MKKINNFFEKDPLWQVYIVYWLLTSVFIMCVFYFGFKSLAPEFPMILTTRFVIGCFIIGAIFAGAGTAMVNLARRSKKFWEYSKIVQELVNKAERKDNKYVRVGSGGGNWSSIRFPKQKANRSVWKKFWTLFPHLENCKSWSEYHEKEAKKNETI